MPRCRQTRSARSRSSWGEQLPNMVGGVKQNPAPVPPLVSVKLSRRAQAAILRRGSHQSQLSRTNMPALEDWFGRKLAAQRGIDQAREVRYRHHRGPGPGSYYAEI